MGTAGSLIVLGAVLALVAWGRMPDLWVAGPAAVLVVATGLVGLDAVGDTLDPSPPPSRPSPRCSCCPRVAGALLWRRGPGPLDGDVWLTLQVTG